MNYKTWLWIFVLVFLGQGIVAQQTNDWRVRVTLKNESVIEGVVLDNRFFERAEVSSFYLPSPGATAEGTGIRLWYVNDSPGFVFIEYQQISKVARIRPLKSPERAQLEEVVRQKIEKVQQEAAEQQARLVAQSDKILSVEEDKQDEQLRKQGLSREELLKNLPAEALELLRAYPPEDGWGSELFHALSKRKLAGANKFVRKTITDADGNKREVIIKKPLGGLSVQQARFVEKFAVWELALKTLQQQEKIHEEKSLQEQAERELMAEKTATPEPQPAEPTAETPGAGTPAEPTEQLPPQPTENLAEKARLAMRVLLYGQTVQDKTAAAQTLGEVGPSASFALPTLKLLLKDEQPQVRQAALGAVIRIGSPRTEVVALLQEVLDKGDLAMKRDALCALADLAPEAKKAMGQMRILLNDFDASLRYLAAITIGEIGDANDSAILKELQRVYWDPDTTVQIAAAWALLQLQGKKGFLVKRFTEGLAHRESAIRAISARALGQLEDPAALESLKKLSADPAEEVRTAVAMAIAHIPKPPEEVKTEETPGESTVQEEYEKEYEEEN